MPITLSFAASHRCMFYFAHHAKGAKYSLWVKAQQLSWPNQQQCFENLLCGHCFACRNQPLESSQVASTLQTVSRVRRTRCVFKYRSLIHGARPKCSLLCTTMAMAVPASHYIGAVLKMQSPLQRRTLHSKSQASCRHTSRNYNAA